MSDVQDWRVQQREAGKRLKGLLLDADITQADVAEAMGVQQSAMSNYLWARRQWPEDFEQRFRDAVARLRQAA